MNYELLEQLMVKLKQFELTSENKKNRSIEDFISWIQIQNQVIPPPKENSNLDPWQKSIEVGISRLLVHMYRYARLHIRKSMADFPELINEDFTYLYTLMRYGSMTKIQLIEKNIHEKSTGQEIIKRLLTHKLIMEEIDESDKRSKRVDMTEKGREAFFRTSEITANVAKIITGNLTANEKQAFFYLLKKLDNFHNPIFLERKEKNIEQLLALIIEPH